jgi:hypothetical protein
MEVPKRRDREMSEYIETAHLHTLKQVEAVLPMLTPDFDIRTVKTPQQEQPLVQAWDAL